MSKKRAPKREVKGASWMDTYGDLVTLLLTFFVLLFASSTISEAKWAEIVEAFTGMPPGSVIEPIDISFPTQAFSSSDLISNQSTEDEPVEESEAEAQIRMQFEELYEKLQEYVESQGLAQAIGLSVSEDGRFIYARIIEGILFDSGYANIRDEEAEQVLTDLGNMFKEYEDSISLIEVVGHTDNVPIAATNPEYEDNRDLSSERANNVVRHLEEVSNITPSTIDGVGRGEYHPVAPNDTPENREKNRRVEFVIESRYMSDTVSLAGSTEVTIVE